MNNEIFKETKYEYYLVSNLGNLYSVKSKRNLKGSIANSADNLEWVTPSENNLHVYENGAWDKSLLYLTIKFVSETEELIFKSQKEAAKYFGVSCSMITYAKNLGVFRNYKVVRGDG